MMKISGENLTRHLTQELAPLYVIYGEALLLAIEASDAIQAAARKAGYTEREVLIAEPGFKWAELRNSSQNLSLFATRKLLDLRIPSGKPGVEGALALQEYCQKLNAETVTLVSLPRLDKTALSSKWFTALSSHGVVVVADDVALDALPAWIANRLKRQNQTVDSDTLAFLSERVEGNLLAAFQEIQKLALLFPAGLLSFKQVKDSVMDVARYDVFKLSEAMLVSDMARYAHILDGLRTEGTSTVLILWALAEDIRTLGKVMHSMQHSGNLAAALREARVWGVRQKLVEHAVQRSSPAMVEDALCKAAYVDRVIKGLCRGDVWDELLQLGVCFSNLKMAKR
jgi:DNA polymerase-3 subunit delta